MSFAFPSPSHSLCGDGPVFKPPARVQQEPQTPRRSSRYTNVSGLATPRTARSSRVLTKPLSPNSQTPTRRRWGESGLPTPKRTRHEEPKEEKPKEIITPAGLYKKARALLHPSTVSQALVGRAREHTLLDSFYRAHIATHEPGLLYVLGQPGTGKTAFVRATISDRKHVLAGTRVVTINCMTCTQPQEIFGRIWMQVGAWYPDVKVDEDDSAEIKLKKAFMSGKRVFAVIVLDEMDSLLTEGTNKHVVDAILSWQTLTNPGVCIVAIANALDFADRMPRVEDAQVIHFTPYSVEQVQEILKQLLSPLDLPVPKAVVKRRNPFLVGDEDENTAPTPGPKKAFVVPAAIELCARKVASSTGDVRRALDLCRKAIDVAEREWRQLAQADENQQPDVIPVGIMHVLEASKTSVAVSGLQRAVTRIRALGVPHKWVLTVLLVLQEQRKPSLTVGLVMDTYIRLWKRYGITHGLGAAEVADVVSSLDAMGGFLTLDQGRLTGRERKVRLSVRGAEVWDAVQIEGAMFKDVVQDEIGWRHAP